MFQNLVTGAIANVAIAIVNVVLLVFNTSMVDTSNPAADLANYTLTFYDDFDDGWVNTDLWNTPAQNGIRKGGYWSMNQCTERDGNLVIKTEYKEDGEFGPGWYTGSLLSIATFEQAFGYYECRCILPKGQGLWSAFWINCEGTGKVNGTGELGSEIDVFESPFGYLPGKSGWKITSNLHYNGYSLQTRYKNVGIFALDNNPYENFNTYSVLWTPDEYIFFINGHEVGRSDFGGVSKVPEYMVLSCEVDGAAGKPIPGWSGDIRFNKEGRNFTSEFIVDYVRVYAPAA